MTERESADERVVDFGYENILESAKTERVKSVFDSVAGRYDLMNDLMSFGLHRIWKRLAVMSAMVRPGHRVLDLAGGTGDLARLFAQRAGDEGEVVISDINGEMLSVGRDRLIDGGVIGNVSIVQANAETLPFASRTFDIVSIAFGLRNVTNKKAALDEMYRILRPGGRALILEFSELQIAPLRKLYDAFSFRLLPKLGEMVAKDGASYRYLAESIRMHPNQAALLAMMERAGFERCRCRNMAGGIVALHDGLRF
jgi:demethylmenaquinone methyltransferase/2-methoxy-6-polyprenyl-1,4-benzoquinol methylase